MLNVLEAGCSRTLATCDLSIGDNLCEICCGLKTSQTEAAADVLTVFPFKSTMNSRQKTAPEVAGLLSKYHCIPKGEI
jgi:hypothetical protein